MPDSPDRFGAPVEAAPATNAGSASKRANENDRAGTTVAVGAMVGPGVGDNRGMGVTADGWDAVGAPDPDGHDHTIVPRMAKAAMPMAHSTRRVRAGRREG